MPDHHSHLRYRPEIDGLRAIAVMAVVLFHAGIVSTGGFVGVDVFYVISGYLITALIVRDLAQGTFTLVGFWERRARRILPALIVLVLATLIAGELLLLPADFVRLGKSAIAQTFFAANIYFCRNMGYFATGTDQMPLLQTWSLAVEEQFYLFMPWLLMGLFYFPALRRRRSLVTILAIVAGLSFVTSVHVVATQPTQAFYLLPSRAWELLLGAVLAVSPPAFFLNNRPKIREMVVWLGIVIIVIPCFAYTNQTPFPGVAALLPCLGAALIIWGNDANKKGDAPPTLAGRLLASRPFVFIGAISYSVYLWHWPLFAFSHYWAFDPLSPGYRSAMVIISLGFGFLSWKFIENPFRHRVVCPTRKSVFIFAGSGLATLFLIGSLIMFTGGFPQRLPAQVAAFADGENGTPQVENVTAPMIASGTIPHFGVQHQPARTDVLLWGDSHAQHFFPALAAACDELGLSGQIISFTSTTPLVGWSQHSQHGLNEQSEKWCHAVVDYVSRTRIRTVIVAAYWEEDEKYAPEKFAAALERTIHALQTAGAKVYVIMQVPSHQAVVPKLLAYGCLMHLSTAAWQSTWPERLAKHKVMYDIKDHSPEFGQVLVDPAPYFKQPSGNLFKIEENGQSLYTDKHHLSSYGSKLVMTPLFEQILRSENNGVSVKN